MQFSPAIPWNTHVKKSNSIQKCTRIWAGKILSINDLDMCTTNQTEVRSDLKFHQQP
jgi:hypothetical protein